MGDDTWARLADLFVGGGAGLEASRRDPYRQVSRVFHPVGRKAVP